MAQIQCTRCGNFVPDYVKVCPHCGNVVSNQNGMQQPYQQQQQQQYQQPYQQQGYQQPPYQQRYQSGGNGGGNKGLLYVIIGLLALLLVGGGLYLFMSKNDESAKAELAEIKMQQEALSSQNEKLTSQNEKLAEQNEKLAEENAKKPAEKVIVKESVPSHRAVSAGGSGRPSVVINGVGVRLRFGPGLDYGYLTWANGATRAPKKGARLTYVGETSEWYQVRYLGHDFYVSKEFSYLEY